MGINKLVARSIPNPYVLALLLSLTHPALATLFTWNGLTGTDFNTATNWSPNGVPGPTDIGIFSGGANNFTPAVATSNNVNSITINDSAYVLSINGPSGNFTLNGTGFNGVANTGFSVVNNNIFSLTNSATSGGARITNNGTLNLQNASVLSTSNVMNSGIVNLNTSGNNSLTKINNSGQANILANTVVEGLFGSGNIALTPGTTLTIGSAVSFTIFGNVTGGGALTKVGTGFVELFGINSYTGLTTVSAGVLEMASIAGAATVGGSGTLEFINSATLPLITVTNAGTTSFLGSSSAGASIINNSNTLNFQGTSTGGSAAITNTGTVSITSSAPSLGSFTLTNNSGGTLSLNTTGSGSSATVINNTGGLVSLLANANIGALSGSGAVSLAGNTLTVGNLNQTSTVTGSVSGIGGAITKVGTGTQTFSGANTYTGLTTVSAGTLALSGTFTGNALVSVGGTLSLVNYDPTTGNSLKLGLTPTSNGLVNVSGTATLQNDMLEVDLAAGVYDPAFTYTLLQGGTVTGQFASVAAVPPLLVPNVIYNANSVQLNFEPQSIASTISGLNATQLSLARNLDMIFALPGLSAEWLEIKGIFHTSTAAGIIQALNAMSTQLFTTSVMPVIDNTFKQVTKALTERGRRFTSNANGHNIGTKTGKGGFSNLANFANYDNRNSAAMDALMQKASYGNKDRFLDSMLSMPEVHFDDMKRLSIADQMFSSENKGKPWIQPFGSIADLDSNAATSVVGYNAKTGGVMVGFDQDINDRLLVGVSGGYAYTNLKFKQMFGDSHVDNLFMSLYGTYIKDAWHLDASITGALNHFKENRNIIFNIINATANNSHNGYSIVPHVGLGYEILVKDVQVEPFINLDYAYNKNKAYTETGAAALNLVVNSNEVSQLQTELGILASKTFNESYGTFTPSASISFVNTKPIKKDVLVSSFVGMPGNFINVGINKNLNYGSATASATFNYNSGSRLSFAYTANVNGRYNNQQASVVYGINL